MKRENIMDRWLRRLPGSARFWRTACWIGITVLIFIGLRAVLLALLV